MVIGKLENSKEKVFIITGVLLLLHSNNFIYPGLFVYSNGDRYDGGWINSIKEGKGIMLYSNGDKYDGNWANGKQEGKGINQYMLDLCNTYCC